MQILRYCLMVTIVLVVRNDVVFSEVLTPARQLFNLISADTSAQTVKDFLSAHRGMNIKNINPHPIFLIFKAIELKNVDVANFLINEGVDISLKGELGLTVLHEAAREGLLSVVELLVKKGFNVNEVTLQNYTSLHFAASAGHYDVVEFLLKNRAAVDIRAKRGTPLVGAIENGHLEVVKLLLDSGADVSKMPTLILSAVSSGKEEMVRLLIERGVNDVNVKRWNGLFALMQAVNKGLNNIVSLLLKNGADVNLKRDSDNWTSLHLAVQKGDAEMVKVLLVATGIDVNAQDKDGNTPLHLAALQGHFDIVNLLLKQNADVTLKNNEEKKPADLASSEEIKNVLESAESKGNLTADPELPKRSSGHKGRRRRYLSYSGALDLVAQIEDLGQKINTDLSEKITAEAHEKLAELKTLDEKIRDPKLNSTERMANEKRQQELYSDIAELLNQIKKEKSSIAK